MSSATATPQRRTDRSYFVYAGRSMWPSFRGNELLICGQRHALGAGDVVVSLRGDGVNVAHRCLGTLPGGSLLTRGDAHLRNDRRPVRPEDVLGVVTAVMRDGQVIPLRPADPELIRLRLIARKAWGKLRRFLGLNSGRRGS